MMDRSVSSFAHGSTPGTLLRLAAASAIVAGALRILAAFIPYVPESPALETLYATIDCGFLFGLAAIYWPVSQRLGRSGAAGYVIATIGAASLIGPDPRMFGLEFYMVGSAIFELGLLILAFACLCRKILGVTALLWIASLAAAVIAVAAGGNDIAFKVAGSALGLSFVWGGFVTLVAARSAAHPIMPTMAFNQVTIGCHDLSESVRFYRALDFRLIVHSPDNGYARFEAPNDTTLSLHQGMTVPANAVLYFEHAQLDDWVRRLAHEGITCDQPPADQSWGWREARLRDPAGNPLCLFSAGVNRRFPPWRIAD
jgi:catechol 2,3-dioxygenase-like lactoylglutathione lyase family enzyme